MTELPYIDWEQAVRVGRKAVHPGPELTPAQITEVVGALRAAADEAPGHVAEVSGMHAPAVAETLVVDRASWIAAMRTSAKAMTAALGAPVSPADPADQLRGRAIGVQAGAVFAVIAGRILGQFDPFGEPSRLLLVAPNVVAVERQLGVDKADFRLWVCLHEYTHRAQFGFAPWLPGHLLRLMKEIIDPAEHRRADGRPRTKPAKAGLPSIADLVIGPEQREAFDQVTAIMSVIEGHADVMMDRVGTAVIPTLPAIRKAFEGHRDRGGWSGVVGKLLGMDLKREQYRDGARFCSAVLDQAGLEVLNLAFSAPAALPTLTELHEPRQWLQRVQA